MVRSDHVGYAEGIEYFLSNATVSIESASEFPCQATFPSGELREVNLIADGGNSVGLESFDEGCDVFDGFWIMVWALKVTNQN